MNKHIGVWVLLAALVAVVAAVVGTEAYNAWNTKRTRAWETLAINDVYASRSWKAVASPVLALMAERHCDRQEAQETLGAAGMRTFALEANSDPQELGVVNVNMYDDHPVYGTDIVDSELTAQWRVNAETGDVSMKVGDELYSDADAAKLLNPEGNDQDQRKYHSVSKQHPRDEHGATGSW